MYSSANPEIKIRAARVLVQRGSEIPLRLLVEILETLSREGLGADTERALLKRQDTELVVVMIRLLDSKDHFVREVACKVLGHSGNRAATPHLLRMIDDPHIMVRRAAGFGLAFLEDPQSLVELKRQYARRQQDDPNVVMALRCALESLGEVLP
jgi:HEAT repeat protein